MRWNNRMKYGNVKVKCLDGTVFDSRKEARRYEELCLLLRTGAIKELRRQVPFELIPAQYETYERYGKNGRRLKDGERCVEKACTYVADFTYVTTDKGESPSVKTSFLANYFMFSTLQYTKKTPSCAKKAL